MRIRARRSYASASLLLASVMAFAAPVAVATTVAVVELRLVIDGYEFVWDDREAAPRPAPTADPSEPPPKARPATLCDLIGIAPGDRFRGLDELQAAANYRERQIASTRLYFNIQITAIPGRADSSRATLLVECKSGFSLRPFGGAIFSGLGDMNAGGSRRLRLYRGRLCRPLRPAQRRAQAEGSPRLPAPVHLARDPVPRRGGGGFLFGVESGF